MRKTRNKNLNEDLAVKLYLDGYTQYKTAQILDTNYAHIRSVLLKKNISIRDKSFNRKQICDDFYFSQIDTHEKAYWLGFLAADGSVSKNKNEISIGLSAKDKSHIEIFKTITNSNSKIFEYTSTVKNKIYDCCKISIYSKQIKIDLKYHNIVPNKSKTLELSKNINPLFINSYLLGIIDGDGNFHLDKEGQMHFSLIGSKKEVEEIQSILA